MNSGWEPQQQKEEEKKGLNTITELLLLLLLLYTWISMWFTVMQIKRMVSVTCQGKQQMFEKSLSVGADIITDNNAVPWTRLKHQKILRDVRGGETLKKKKQ